MRHQTRPLDGSPRVELDDAGVEARAVLGAGILRGFARHGVDVVADVHADRVHEGLLEFVVDEEVDRLALVADVLVNHLSQLVRHHVSLLVHLRDGVEFRDGNGPEDRLLFGFGIVFGEVHRLELVEDGEFDLRELDGRSELILDVFVGAEARGEPVAVPLVVPRPGRRWRSP